MGFILAKKNILTVSTCRDISDTVVSAIMPCLIFDNMVSYLKSSDIKNFGIIMFTACLLFLVGGLLTLATHYITRSPKRWLGGLISVGIFPNISDLPIAYLQTFTKTGTIFTPAEGDKGVAYVCLFLFAMILFQFSFGLFRLIQWDFRDELKVEGDLEKQASSGSATLEEEKENVEKDKHSNEKLTSYETEAAAAKNNHDDSAEQLMVSNELEPSSSPSRSEASSTNTESISSESILSQRLSNRDEDVQHSEFLKAHSTGNMNNDSVTIPATTKTRNTSSVRRTSRATSNADSNTLELVASRNADLRRLPSQNVNDVINEYSEFDSLRNSEIEKTKSLQSDPKSVKKESKFKEFGRTMFKNLIQPSSVSLLLSIAICMSPPLKALFVPTSFYMPNAPDEQPPLSFLIDLTSYVGAASVPLGLLLLGATLARLQVKKMPPGFWKTALMVTITRMVLLPIFGVGLTTGMYKGGWYGTDRLVRFVSVLEFGLPNATSLVYFTAFYTDPLSDEHLQMDCLAVCLIIMALYYNLVFVLLVIEMVFFGILSLPYPRRVRRTVLQTISAPFKNEQFQIALKCVLGFVFVLFIDSVNRVYAVTSELHSATQAHPGSSVMNDRSEIQARRFYAQRNMYLCGFTLFLTLILTRTYNLVVELIVTKDKVDELKKGDLGAAGDKGDLGAGGVKDKSFESKEITKLKNELAEKDAALELLKNQAASLNKEYDEATVLKGEKATGSNSEKHKDITELKSRA
ncbi:ECM3 [Candida oxycetoniae]|uniref:ECM3 n=1 Tax=Candida oxycetoniae TaxID=497107 RepID=A0AAI9T268_9ASCO|nr:ECM3 [Candida oxycetoniae]KAI3406750.2 ECM3 [Candida oxycetoniae]